MQLQHRQAYTIKRDHDISLAMRVIQQAMNLWKGLLSLGNQP